jgi:hypothetical protein
MANKKVIEIYEETRRLIGKIRDSVEESTRIEMEVALAEIENKYLEEINKFNDIIKVANETNQLLMDAMPKVLGPEGASLCRTAERVFPGDKVILIRYSPSTKKAYLTIVPDENGKYLKLEEFADMTRFAVGMANKMVDDEGRLSKIVGKSDIEN